MKNKLNFKQMTVIRDKIQQVLPSLVHITQSDGPVHRVFLRGQKNSMTFGFLSVRQRLNKEVVTTVDEHFLETGKAWRH